MSVTLTASSAVYQKQRSSPKAEICLVAIKNTKGGNLKGDLFIYGAVK